MTNDLSYRMKSIQTEYYSIFDDILGEDISIAARFSDKEIIDFINRRSSENTFVIPYRGVNLSSFEYRLLNFTESITEFWNINKKSMVKYVRQLTGNKIQLPYNEYMQTLSRDVKKLAAYFDTVVLPDNFMYWSSDIDFSEEFYRKQLANNFRRAATLYKIKDISFLEAETPLIAILPTLEETDSIQVNSYVLSFLDEIFPGFFSKRNSALEVVMDINSRDAKHLLNIAKKSDLFERTLSDFDITPLSRTILDVQSGKARTLFGYMRDLPVDIFIKSFITTTHTWFNTYCNYQLDASVLGNDLIVGKRMWELHKWHLEFSASKNFSKYSLNQDELSALSVLHPSVDFLGDISDEELLYIRKHKELKEIQQLITIERHRIKTMSLEDFSTEAEKNARRILEAISVYEKELQVKLSEKRKRDRLSLLGLGLAVTLGVSSIAVPVLAIPAAAFGFVAGTSSLRGAINDHLTGEKNEKNFWDDL